MITYEWKDAGNNVISTNQTVTNLGPGTYTVTVTDAAGCVATCSTTVATPQCNNNPDIELVKTGALNLNVVAPNGVANAGDQIVYSFTVTNTGNVTLTNVTVSDPQVTIVGGPIASLAPGQIDNTTFTATYTLTVADILAGSFTNLATATGTPPSGPPVDDDDDDLQTFPLPRTAILGDFVFNDLDHDGLQDANEPGVPNIHVTLYDEFGNFVAKDTTDSQGKYLFTVLPGRYYLRFTNLPANFVFSPSEVGSNDEIDSDANPNGFTVILELLPGETDLSWDAGIYERTGVIGDRVWNDLNKNGQQNPGEPGVQGIQVRLYTGGGILVATTATDLNGNYYFYNVSAGTYYVEFGPLPGGYAFSPKDAAGDSEDSDANPNGRTDVFSLAAGQTDLRWDAAIFMLSASVGDFVWCDENANGCQDPGEQVVRGVVVTLYNANGGVVSSTTTNSYGRYQFSGLTPGAYQIGFSGLPANFIFTDMAACNDNTTDSDVDPATGKTGLFSLAAGQDDNSRDAGVRVPQQGIGNFVWNDLNRDGIQDLGEPGVQGVTVYLYNANSNPVGFTTTDAQGFYSFASLPVGTYFLAFGSIPQGWAFSPQAQGGDSNKDSDVNAQGVTGMISLVLNASRNDVDAGIYNPLFNPPVLVAKVLLEGAYDANTQTMRRDLNTQQLLPLLQPYQQAPWNYNALVAVNNLPADVVDWVMVEFRSASDATQVLDTQVGLLKANGDIVGVDGISPIFGQNLGSANQVYVVVKHRNHLAVMSAFPLSKGSNGFVADLSSGLSAVYGDVSRPYAPAMELTPGGKVMMMQGDSNSDNLVNSLDLGVIMSSYFSTGLNAVDINLDGVTNSLDIGRAMQRYFRSSHVPE